MASTWINPSKSHELIVELSKKYSITTNGALSYQIVATYYLDALFGFIKHTHKLDNETLFSIFTTTIEACYRKNKLSKSTEVLKEFDKACNRNLNKQEIYRVITEINIKNIHSIPRITINGCVISFYNALPDKYKKARDKHFSLHPEVQNPTQENYTSVCISTKAANRDHAIDNAINTLDFIRAILQIGFRKDHNLLATPKEHEFPTYSVIQCGSLHTIHSSNGKMIGSEYWTNLSFQDKKKATSLKRPEKTYEHLKKVVKRLKKSAYSDYTLLSLTNYIDAVDRADPELRFMKLWSTLEKLTMSDETKTVALRASFFFQERAIHEAILLSLRNSRNSHIHGGQPPINIELKNYQLCGFIEHMLNFFISNPFKYSTIDEIRSLISLPTQAKDLKAQIETLKTVQKFIGEN
ncbi:hypothetical protein [Pseudomonas syringae]|uniref:hypothetical protein n=1 Tax=Pseudomonas syringae TaxID=317 RepID=UPI003F75C198